MFLAHFFQTFLDKGDKVVRDTGKGFVEDNEQVLGCGGALANEFKKEQFALSATQTGGKFTSHGTTNLDGVGRALLDVNVPVGQLRRVKVGDAGDTNVRAGRVVLTCAEGGGRWQLCEK